MAATVDLAHVFVGCNAISNAFCANSSGGGYQQQQQIGSHSYHAAFAAKNAVALVGRDPQNSELLQIKQTLQHRVSVGDATRITSVFLSSSEEQDRVFAGDSEGNVFLWQRISGEQSDWQLLNLSSVPQADNTADGATKRISTSSVAVVAAAETSKRWIYFVSFSNGTLVAFEQHRQHPERVNVLAQLDLGVRFIMETLAVCTIDMSTSVADSDDTEEANVLLAAGGVDSKVYLYEVPANASLLSQLLVLEGHRGWIRGLSFEKQQHSSSDTKGSKSLFLASASQDQRVRLWKVTASPAHQDAPRQASAATNETRDGFQAAGANCSYTASFDALLIGHEDWVTSLEWTLVPKASQLSDDKAEFESALVSSSMDNALIVWKKNMQLGVSGAWFPSLRVGEMGGNGILRGVVLPNGSEKDSSNGRLDLLALNFMGQLERWKQQPSPSKIFLPSPSLTGHCLSVTDLSWSPAGDYLLSVSLDQTARVLAPMKKEESSCQSSWHEISRAQVHGYDLNCACFLLGPTAGSDRFVSGADEKILRVFEAPDDIQALVSKLSGLSVDGDSDASRQHPRVQHAYLPELSLTNKTSADASSSSESSSGKNDGYAVIDTESPDLRLPVGDTLGKKTLWPEQRKLYGHGNELLCVASNHSGSLIASACKSREERFASIWLWNTSDWSVAQAPLEGHKSSVVQLAFSPNDQLLLSVSRDRQFCVYERGQDGKFALVEKLKAHKRIIWSCSWSPDSRFFATVSRDQMLAIWGKATTGGWRSMGKMVAFESAATAVAFAPLVSSSSEASYVVAVGLESGAIKLFRVTPQAGDSGEVGITLVCDVGLMLSPSATVTRLAWSPRQDSKDTTISNNLVLAASSCDFSVRLYNVELGK
ncbi:Elongator complex protein 2 [Globisporangium polare]